MATTVKFDVPFAEITGQFDGMIFRRTPSGKVTMYKKPVRNLKTHPVRDNEKRSQQSFRNATLKAKAILTDPIEWEKYRIGWEVYCTTKPISRHAYLVKVCYHLEKENSGEG